MNTLLNKTEQHTLGVFHFSTCEGIHEGGQGPVEHLKEGIPARILLRSTQNRVLQDVGDPGAVHGGGPELDTEMR